MTRPAPPSASWLSRLRLSQYSWAQRILLVVGALVGSAAVAYAANIASRGALWQVVRACEFDHATTGSPLPCLDVDRDRGFVVLRPPVGYDTILAPTRRVVGIEDPALQAPDAPNYFALAWQSRRWATANEPPSDERIALSVNSRLARSQDQLHVHIGCLSPDFAGRLSDGALGPKPGVWRRGPDLGRKLEFWTYRSGSRDWDGLDPFRLARELVGDSGSLARTMLSVVATPGEFVVVALRSRPGGWYASADDIVDARCS